MHALWSHRCESLGAAPPRQEAAPGGLQVLRSGNTPTLERALVDLEELIDRYVPGQALKMVAAGRRERGARRSQALHKVLHAVEEPAEEKRQEMKYPEPRVKHRGHDSGCRRRKRLGQRHGHRIRRRFEQRVGLALGYEAI